ncbi:MAG: SH3 domain-containing protein [Oscillospiraceae bacterium]|jgi:hypothetical protein|nr:SH3 domain-containing protein [Oscillospiraceae bacterium]
MKKYFILVLAAIVITGLLTSCVERADRTSANATNDVSEQQSTEMSTSTSITPAFREFEGTNDRGLVWNTFDLSLPEVKDDKLLLTEQISAIGESTSQQSVYMLADGRQVMIFENDKLDHKQNRVMLVRTDGTMTEILCGNGIYGEEITNPVEVYPLSERYIAVRWMGWEWEYGITIYDLQEMKEVKLPTPYLTGGEDSRFFAFRGSEIFFINSAEEDPPTSAYSRPLHISYIDTSVLPDGELKTVDLPVDKLAPVALDKGMFHPTFALTGHHLVYAELGGVVIVDMTGKQEAWHIPVKVPPKEEGVDSPSDYPYFDFRGDCTLIAVGCKATSKGYVPLEEAVEVRIPNSIVRNNVPADQAKQRVVTGGSTLNMRSEPDISSSVVARIPNKSAVSAIAAEGDWVQVFWEEKIGWVAAKYLAAE